MRNSRLFSREEKLIFVARKLKWIPNIKISNFHSNFFIVTLYQTFLPINQNFPIETVTYFYLLISYQIDKTCIQNCDLSKRCCKKPAYLKMCYMSFSCKISKNRIKYKAKIVKSIWVFLWRDKWSTKLYVNIT